MQINPYFQIGLPSPPDGFVDIGGCALDIWVAVHFLVGPIYCSVSRGFAPSELRR